MSAGAVDALELVSMPAYIVDNDLRVRWQNAASRALVGDLRGRLEVGSKVVPEDLDRAREAFTQKQDGAAHTEVELSVLRCDGTLVRVAVSSVPLRNPAGDMIGSFGLVQVLRELEPASERPPRLSPRERETLALLAAGHSTTEIGRADGDLEGDGPQPRQARAARPRRQLPRGGRRQGPPRRARLIRFGR